MSYLLLALLARLQALGHIARWHDVTWNGFPQHLVNPDDLQYFCGRDIICETCHTVLWCRSVAEYFVEDEDEDGPDGV